MNEGFQPWFQLLEDLIPKLDQPQSCEEFTRHVSEKLTFLKKGTKSLDDLIKSDRSHFFIKYPLDELHTGMVFFIKQNGKLRRTKGCGQSVDLNNSNRRMWPKDDSVLCIIPGYVLDHETRILRIAEFYLFEDREDPEYDYRWRFFSSERAPLQYIGYN